MSTFTIPTIETARLTLRAPVLADFEPYATFLASDRSRYMDGPHSRDTAWGWFCNDTAHWVLYGFGALVIEAAGQPAGVVVISQGQAFPEPELGWFLFDGFTGQGYAAEAAFTLRDWAYANTGLTTLVSYVAPENTASHALAQKLGATVDETARRPAGEGPEDCVVYRHPSPAALADGGIEAYA